ncbi:MAG: hypothetical protein IPH82_26835 [Chloroflexi bacterium]|nr:hypothetical protein [Chloroflexota bacterium]
MMQQVEQVASERELLAELAARNLHLVVGSRANVATGRLPTDVLLAGLVQDEAARLHPALIALFSLPAGNGTTAVPAALRQLAEAQQVSLKLFYTAAVLLQQIHGNQLRQHLPNQQSLPDLFAASFGLDGTAVPQVQLQQLSVRHRELSGVKANWLGSYHYAADRLLARLAKEAAWAA